ncbi:hypothetical protein PG999_014084 [Apiospora kogelbergensis]|uniref:Heterokaryon incompatibility domain-containing protein n=1 Tax=Apiospora kogelbergensis TaxID=1337665 RepID=A0AAW0QA22_9PEZI
MAVYGTQDGNSSDKLSSHIHSGEIDEYKLVSLLNSDDQGERYLGHGELQAWAIFAVIKNVFGVSLDPIQVPRPRGGSSLDDYIQGVQKDGLLQFDTTDLRAVVEAWVKDTRRRVVTDSQRLNEHSRVLKIISDAIQLWTKVHLSTRRQHAVDANLMLSAALLYEYISWASRIACEQTTSEPVFPYAADFVTQHMRSVGWCPAELRVMEHSFSLLQMWRLSFLDVPHLGKDHSPCENADKCRAYQIEESAYKTAHDPSGHPDCQCEFVYASQSELSSILLGPAEGIPMVQNSAPRRNPADNRLYVELIPSRTPAHPNSIDWVAISHVWSDGLGNNKSNSIPLCQFNRLCKLSSSLSLPGIPERPPFWLDTLCFPLKPKEAYDKAMVRMKESYEGAQAVLVLDGYLLGTKVQVDGMSTAEIMARIILCPWNRRLWTWQEAFLAHRNHLFFQFKDVAICDKHLLDECEGQWMTEFNQSMEHALSLQICWRFQDIRSRDENLPIMEKIAKAKDTLTFRSTSQAPDEALCLSNILGVDVADILKTEGEDRMVTFWKKVLRDGQYHASMIFWDGPKLNLQGFRWAPATFMDASRISKQHQSHLLDGRVTGLSPFGLHVRLPSVICSELKISDHGLCHIKAQKQTGWSFSTMTGHEDELHFMLDLDDWSKVRAHQKVTKGFVVLLPWLWENDSWQADVQVAGRLEPGGDKLHLLSSGTMMLLEEYLIQSGLAKSHAVEAFVAAEATWMVD